MSVCPIKFYNLLQNVQDFSIRLLGTQNALGSVGHPSITNECLLICSLFLKVRGLSIRSLMEYWEHKTHKAPLDTIP
ncbi:hypothetical protein XELAEV_18026216mg [Xenopus laevis]|uniref:Uncharacterized protein n=1 Tax=Xenopus laevis TaxID=8355 RepID=A0A974CTH7_XENLA|nr:hypothetical protein XELAEV_18026216mg [Xenopus laevis]